MGTRSQNWMSCNHRFVCWLACGEETTQLYNIQILCVHMMDGHVPYKCIHVNEKLSRERIGVGFEHKILT